MNNHYGIILPSLKIGGGNRVLLQFAEMAIRDNKKAKLFYLNRKGSIFKKKIPTSVSQFVFNEGVFTILLAALVLSFKIRFSKSIGIALISDPILSIFSFIYSNKKIIRYVQSNDALLFEENFKANIATKTIYKFFFKLSQNYKYHKVLFNSKYSLASYNKTLVKLERFNYDHIVNPAVFSLAYKASVKKPNLSNPNICIVTNLHPRKGLEKFLNIVRMSKLKDINYYVISQDHILTPIKNVSIVRPKSDNEYINILNKCHIIVSTSSFEGFGLPLIEGMALGLVPVAIYNKGLEEYNKKRNIVFFKDVVSYDQQISKIITNYSYYKKLSNSAAKSASFFTEGFFYKSMIQKIKIS